MAGHDGNNESVASSNVTLFASLEDRSHEIGRAEEGGGKGELWSN